MEWLKNLNAAVDYIERNLEGDIDIEKAARLAACSCAHFQRMFSYMVDYPLTEYIRRRRMTKAAIELRAENSRIIDVSLKYGYDSPTAFNRAFQSVHGVAPSKAKKEGVVLKAYPPIRFIIAVKGEDEMKYRIEKKGAFRIVGVREQIHINVPEAFQEIPSLWGKHAGRIPELCKLMSGKEPVGVLGVTACMSGEKSDYYIGVTSEAGPPQGMESYEVPASTWAIFDCVGAIAKDPGVMQKLQKRIFSEWLPMSSYQYADAPDIEVYLEGDQASDDYHCEVWLPIKEK